MEKAFYVIGTGVQSGNIWTSILSMTIMLFHLLDIFTVLKIFCHNVS